MKGNKWKIIIVLLGILIVPFCFAQSSKTLKNRRSKTLRQIEFTKKILKETKSKKKESLNTLNALQNLIVTREKYLLELSTELNSLETQILEGKIELSSAKEKLYLEKKRLGSLVYTMYKTKSAQNRIGFILSSESFNQAMRRIDYFNQIAKHQTQFIENIDIRAIKIEETLQLLEGHKMEKDSVLITQIQEQTNLLSDKDEKEKVVSSLQGQEDDLKKKLKKQRTIAANLNNAIKRAIAKEIEIARKKKEAERKRREAERRKKEAARRKRAKEAKSKEERDRIEKEKIITATPEKNRLEATFLANKGKLPWPVVKGYISQRFGRREHESLAGIVIENNGVDIATSNGASARALFEGEVSAVMEIPGMGLTVLISHGNYFTVYAKLKEVKVKQGDRVTTKQSLGTVMTGDAGATIIHLEIWQGQAKQNPALWLVRR